MTHLSAPEIARSVIVVALLTVMVSVAASSSAVYLPGRATTTEAEANAPRGVSSAEQHFLAENASSMATMMRGMQSRPTGDIDRDFVQQMIPHHQGAIDMAKALIEAGHNERLKRLAQEIIITQQEEIQTMRLLVAGQESAERPKRAEVSPR
jgi:2-keto-3-deoxy-6-phosphogluconate aldolase